MAARIIYHAEGGTAGRRLSRTLIALVGVVLLLAGLLAAGILAWFLVIVVSNTVDGIPLSSLRAGDYEVIGVFAAAALAGLWLGLALVRGRRRVGLYLRKFGFSEATSTLSRALRSSAGRAMRLVTLDDDMVAPIGAGRSRRALTALAAAAGTAAAGLILYELLSGRWESGKARDAARNEADAHGFTGKLAAAAGTELVYALILLALIALACVVAVVALAAVRAYLAARRAEKQARRALARRTDIGPAATRLRRIARRVLAPRLVVVRVPTAFWQDAIRGLAKVCDLVIIDVSQPTDALLWEVRNIKPLFDGRWILVGAADRVAALADPETARLGTPQGLLARLIDGERVLAYGAGAAGRSAFVRMLRYEAAHLGRR